MRFRFDMHRRKGFLILNIALRSCGDGTNSHASAKTELFSCSVFFKTNDYLNCFFVFDNFRLAFGEVAGVLPKRPS
jgi:hypothetical protein